MQKIKCLFNKIIHMDFNNMFKVTKSVAKKSNKCSLLVFFDIIYCGFKYGAGYYDYQEFEFYNLNRLQRSTYLTRSKNEEIIRKYNDKSKFPLFESKVLFNKTFKEFINREWMLLDNNKAEFVDFFKKHKELIVKPIDLSGGEGIEKIIFVNEKDSLKKYDELIKNKQLLIEEVIKQNNNLDKLYDKSVNTLRMYTFYKDGEVHFLEAILKIGNGGVIDNFSSGGMYAYVNDKGKVFTPAIDRADNIFYEHPITKEKIVGFEVPLFNEAVETVKECACVIPEVQYVGWDVAITNDKIELVEGNCFPGVYQVKASLSKDKEGLLTKYKKIMDI